MQTLRRRKIIVAVAPVGRALNRGKESAHPWKRCAQVVGCAKAGAAWSISTFATGRDADRETPRVLPNPDLIEKVGHYD